MRRYVDRAKLEQFMHHIGARATSPGVVYLVGGATALLLGFREQTVDIDIKLDPEPGGIFHAIAELKERLGINVELAAPDQFIPPLPGWRDRSPLIRSDGPVQFRHYDFYSQALAKIERGHDLDLTDAASLVEAGKVDLSELIHLAKLIQSDLVRYPAINVEDFERQLLAFAGDRAKA
jgi:hypothetical protein